METVERLGMMCVNGWHQHRDSSGTLHGCPGVGLANDMETAIGNFAGEIMRVRCTCECHKPFESAPEGLEHDDTCAGCYWIGPGIKIHPPVSGRW